MSQSVDMSKSPLPRRLSAQPIDLTIFKGLKFVILDPMLFETREIYDEISGTFQWQLFQNLDEPCANYIKNDCINKRVFLIASGSMGRKIVPMIHDLPQLYAVYIFCADVESNQQWALEYSKVRLVCNDDDKYLLPLFAVDVAQTNIEWADAFVQAAQYDKAKEKYNKALSNLNRYERFRDVEMLNDVTKKLQKLQ